MVLVGDSSSTTAAAARRFSDAGECEGILQVCVDGPGELEDQTQVAESEVGGLEVVD